MSDAHGSQRTKASPYAVRPNAVLLRADRGAALFAAPGPAIA